MSSLSSLSPRELERLSAYADGELAPQEAEGLRARLDQDPRLRQALAEIQQTAGLLRSLPALPPPRSFALSPGRASATRRYPRLQLATAMAGLAFFLVVGVDVLTSATRMAMPSLQSVGDHIAEAPQADFPPAPAGAELEHAAPEAEVPLAPLEVAGTPAAEALAAEAVGTPALLGQAAPAEALSASATSVPTEGLAAAAPQTATAPGLDEESGAAALAQPTAEPEEAYRAAQAATEMTTPSAALKLQQEAPAAAQDLAAVGAQTSTPPESEVAPARAGRGVAGLALRLLEAGLGTGALVLAVLTVRARRQR